MSTVRKDTAGFENVQWSYDYDNETFRLLTFRCENNSDFDSEGTIISQAPLRLSGNAYIVDDIIHTNPENGFVYRCTRNGVSAQNPPTFPTTVGATANDGGARWRCIGPDKAVRIAPAGQVSTFALPVAIQDLFNIAIDVRGRLLGIDQAYRMLG